MDDEVRKLLTDFADRTVREAGDGGGAADVDADGARGRRALRRLRLRRRTAGVLALATAVAAVALTGGPGAWFAERGTDVATDTPLTSAPASSETGRADPDTPSVVPFGTAEAVVLAKGAYQWGDIGCGLAPAGWRTLPSSKGYAVLAPPSAGTSAGTDLNGKLVLRTAGTADRILRVDAVRQPGRIVHFGWYENGARVAQTKLGGTWLIVRTPLGGAGWDDGVLLRFVDSCSVTTVELTPSVRSN